MDPYKLLFFIYVGFFVSVLFTNLVALTLKAFIGYRSRRLDDASR